MHLIVLLKLKRTFDKSNRIDSETSWQEVVDRSKQEPICEEAGWEPIRTKREPSLKLTFIPSFFYAF